MHKDKLMLIILNHKSHEKINSKNIFKPDIDLYFKD